MDISSPTRRRVGRERGPIGGLTIIVAAVCLLCLPSGVLSVNWGSSNGDTDYSIYGNSFTRDWLDGTYALSMKVEGCVWGNVADSEEVGCLENDSEDGTTNWYMMANCKRPQVVVSVYASSGSSSCSSSYFAESFVTTVGLSEFIYYLQTYDAYSGFNNEFDDDGGYEVDELPNCENGENGYIGLDCTSDGKFTVNYFEDEYCLTRTGTVYNNLYSINNVLSNYKSCTDISSYGYINGNNGQNDGEGGGGENDYQATSFIEQLVYYSSESCSSYDYEYCVDSDNFDNRRSHKTSATGGTAGRKWANVYMGSHKSWVTKLKYVVGGLFLLASFIMFTGILFTNRRRRRAMMMRKYRQSKKEKSREKSSSSRKSGRSRSRSRRSSSRPKSSSAGGGSAAAEGVLT